MREVSDVQQLIAQHVLLRTAFGFIRNLTLEIVAFLNTMCLGVDLKTVDRNREIDARL